MELQNKTILIISPDKWTFLPVSKHHYAITLAENNDVYYLNPPSGDSADAIDKNVKIINSYKRVKGLRFAPQFIRKQLMKKEANSILKKVEGGKIDVVWSFDSSRLYYLDLFKSQVKIAHIVDFSENFKFNELVSSANLCLSVSRSITSKILKINPKVFFIQHGLNSGVITNTDVYFKKKTGIYLGNLNMKYIDWESVYLMISTASTIDFLFYGPLDKDTIINNDYLSRLMRCENARFEKAISPELASSILIKADFCFLNYLHEIYPEQLENSHKLMQYMGSGTPVFCSRTIEYVDLGLVHFYDNSNNVRQEFEKFIMNKSGHFLPLAKEKRIKYATDNTYSKQIERIEKIIASL